MARPTKRSACLYRHEHTDGPVGFVAWHEWAVRLARTHDQLQCIGCGLWAIWKAKS